MTHAVTLTPDPSTGNPLSNLKNEEPVLVGAAVLWVLAQVGTILVGHKVIGTQQWTSLTNTVAPVAVTVVLGAIAWFTRSVVDSPKTSKLKTQALAAAQDALEKTGTLNDADFARLAYWVEERAHLVAEHVVGSASAYAAKQDPGLAGSLAGKPATVAASSNVTSPPTTTIISTPPPDDPGSVPAPLPTAPIQPAGSGQATPIADQIQAQMAQPMTQGYDGPLQVNYGQPGTSTAVISNSSSQFVLPPQPLPGSLPDPTQQTTQPDPQAGQ